MIQTWPKQPDSASLIRHRRYDLCVVCEERPSVGSNVQMMLRIPEEGQAGMITADAVFTKWWTCLKCEEVTK